MERINMRAIGFFLLLFFFLQPSEDKSSVSATETNSFGYINGQFSVTDAGSATYGIPLSLSPGTAGMTPELTIAYNSQGSNGILGNGWSLLGISTISRSGKTLAQDNEIRGVKIDGSDTYSLDGERLVLVSGTYGADGAEYRTEQNAFMKVVSFGNVNGSPEKFRVWTNSGLIMEYGFTGNSRVEVQQSGSIVHWLVNKIQDTKGNYILFNYEKDIANGDYRPTSIEYTGNVNTGLAPYNHVEFYYEDRPDNIPRYVMGRKIQSNKILKAIKSFHEDQLAREYRFEYTLGTYSGICLLNSVTECGSDGSCLEPTTFKWKEENELDFTQNPGLPAGDLDNDNIAVFQGDWNGDGRIDLLRFNTQTGGNKFYFNSWDFDFTSSTSTNPINPGDLDEGLIQFADFNTDGLTDIFWYNPFTGANRWFSNQGQDNDDLSFVRINNLIPTGELDLINNQNVSVIPSDWNGDGRTDLLIYHQPSGTNRFYLNNSENGETFEFTSPSGTGNLIPSSWVSNGSGLFPLDWDGDGLTDLIWYDEASGATKWIKNSGNGNDLSFSPPVNNPIAASAINGGDGIQFGDWNGDGLPDLMWHDMGSGESVWFFNKGDLSFVEADHNLNPSILSGYESIYLLDINGDSFNDAVLYDKESGNNLWLFNDGRCHFTGASDLSNLISPGAIDGGTTFTFGGYSGQSIIDAFWYNKSNGTNRFFKSDLGVSNLVDTIRAGNGYTVAIDYRPLTEEGIYTQENNATYPDFDFQNKFYVVCSYSVDNGVGGVNKMSYRYKGAKMNLHGRGFRGFKEIHVTDETSGVVTSRFMNRDHRYIGSPLEREEVRLPNGTLISETINKDTLLFFYNNNDVPLSTHFAYTYESTSTSYEIDGSLVSSITTRNELDDYGNVVKAVVDYGNGYIDSTYNFYEYSGFLSNWILGRLVRAEVTKFAPGQAPVTKISAFEYDPESGLMIREVTEPDLPPEDQIEKTYVHDAYGNIVQSTVTFYNGDEQENRNTFSSYDDRGRFLISATNDLGHTKTTEYDPVLGHKTSETDPNGLTTTYQYDPFGRIIRTDYPDGTWRTQSYNKCNGDCPPGAVFYIQAEATIDPPHKEYFDILGREVLMETVGFSGDPIFERTDYNELGLISRKSDPYYEGDPILWTELEYDILGREITVTEPGGLVNQTIFDGLTTTQINPKGQSKTVTKNVIGQTISVTDNQDNTITYQYDATGNLTGITDQLGNVISMIYDIYSNKASMTDPDMGTYSYTYNSIGELLSQTDPKGNALTFEYDVLGRMINRSEPEGETTWTYDTQENGIGLLASISSDDFDYHYEILYDELSRIYKSKETIEGELYETSFYYDEFGRPQSIYYPYGLAIRHEYNEYNYLSEIRNLGTNQLYWEANEFDAKGQLTRQTLGNNITTEYAYNTATNWLEGIQSHHTQGAVEVQNLAFTYDNIGNLTQRLDYLQGLTEDFTYDGLNRLTSSIIPFQDTVDIEYDILGNITSKSDVGAYFYGENGAGPHQLTRIEGNGTQSCIPSSVTDFTYTSFNKVQTISRDSFRQEIDYAPSYSRTVQRYFVNDSLVKKKIHVGSILEIEVTDSLARALHYIRGGQGVVAVHNEQTNGESFTHYWHKDHLGSLQAVSDEDGELVQVLSYDAWGKRRNPDGSSIEEEEEHEYDRGFTGHEHIDWFSLINMNGRIYDPVVGRFISPDPFIQDDMDLQNLNRYSYVLNNPLSYNDPSGYFFKKIGGALKKVGKGIVNGVKKTVRVFKKGVSNLARGTGQILKGDILKGFKNIGKGVFQISGSISGAITANELGKTVFGEELWNTLVVSGASIAVGMLTLPAGGAGGIALGSVLLSGAASGFTGSTLGVMLGGGSLSNALLAGVKGAVIGGVMAGATFGVGSLAERASGLYTAGTFSEQAAHYGVKMVGHGVVQGGMRELNGGSFAHGMAVGALTSLAGPIIDKNFSSLAGQTIASAVVGGTASVIGGGKFVNGAVSGAMIRMYNDWLHRTLTYIGAIASATATIACPASATPVTAPTVGPVCIVSAGTSALIAGYSVGENTFSAFDNFSQGNATSGVLNVQNIIWSGASLLPGGKAVQHFVNYKVVQSYELQEFIESNK